MRPLPRRAQRLRLFIRSLFKEEWSICTDTLDPKHEIMAQCGASLVFQTLTHHLQINSRVFAEIDSIYMRRALTLAEQGLYTTAPNPRVGCVLVKDGHVIGEGFTQPVGGAHAEIQALSDARARGHETRGATVYVSLEPCSHFGHTPPCADALINARIAGITAAMEDPNPLVAGQGFAQLRAAHIDVRCGLLAREAYELNIGFITRMMRGRPWVRLKMAASLDGGTALPNGESQWITSAAARADGHLWRARACAVLTGIGTVLKDNPRLTVRGVDTPRQPLRVLVDGALDIPLTAHLLEGAPPLIVCASARAAQTKKADALRARGAEIIALESSGDAGASPRARVDLAALLRLLGARGINELHVEAGADLSGALLAAQCVDELLVYLAPSLLGDAQRMFSFAAPATLAQRPMLSFHAIQRIGDEARILARFEPAPHST